jgi:hypothetical protein
MLLVCDGLYAVIQNKEPFVAIFAEEIFIGRVADVQVIPSLETAEVVELTALKIVPFQAIASQNPRGTLLSVHETPSCEVTAAFPVAQKTVPFQMTEVHVVFLC